MVREGMRGGDQQQNQIFSYLSPEERVRKDHLLRAIRTMVDKVLTQLSRRFDAMYARVGHPSIAPEKLLRAQLLQMLYSIRSERLLMEEMDYNLLLRWFDALSQKKRKRIEECFGWLKTIALMRKVRHRGVCRVDWIFTMACAAYNLVRMRNLTAAVPAV